MICTKNAAVCSTVAAVCSTVAAVCSTVTAVCSTVTAVCSTVAAVCTFANVQRRKMRQKVVANKEAKKHEIVNQSAQITAQSIRIHHHTAPSAPSLSVCMSKYPNTHTSRMLTNLTHIHSTDVDQPLDIDIFQSSFNCLR